MKLLLKILMFILVALITNMKVMSATIRFTNIQEATTSFSLHTEISETVFKVFENDLVNYCQNEKDLVVCRDWGTSIEALAAKGSHLVYQGLDAAGKVRYVGITGREAAVRFGEHLNSSTARSLLDYRVIDGATGLSKTGAKVLEQTLINQYGLQKI